MDVAAPGQEERFHLGEGERRQKYFAFPISISVAVLQNLGNSVIGCFVCN